MQNNSGLLPIGSVVTLKGGDKKLMIHGRVQYSLTAGKTFDYAACLYPEGVIGEDMYLFDREDIETVDFVGYIDSDEKALSKFLESWAADHP